MAKSSSAPSSPSSVILAASLCFLATTTLCYTVLYNQPNAAKPGRKPGSPSRRASKAKKKKKKKKAERVPVGVGVVAYDQESCKMIVGQRKGSHGDGLWALPGGWLERNESLEGCALREMFEETGLTAQSFESCRVLGCQPCVNDEFNSLTVFVLILLKKDVEHKPVVCEPEKCAEWKWMDLGKPQSGDNLFPSLRYLLSDVELKKLIAKAQETS